MIDANRPIFSIIIPVYNGGKVIERCIKSILEQRYQNFETIIIDDGSTDETGDICKKYSNEDSRIQYHWQRNGGVSSARNNGLQLAKCEYILFVDADDFLLTDYVHSFYDSIVRENIDKETFVLQDFIAEIHYKNGKEEAYNWCGFKYGRYSLNETFNKLKDFNWLYWGVPFSKLYRLSVIKSNNLTFSSEIQGREDLVFMLEYMKHISTVVFEPVANYQYIIDKTKETVSNVATSFSNEYAFFNAMKRLSDFYIQRFKLSEDIQLIMYKYVYLSFFRCLNTSLYLYKIPMSRRQRIKNIHSLSTKEHLKNLTVSGAIDSKMKRFAFALLKSNLFSVYDLLNSLRYRFN